MKRLDRRSFVKAASVAPLLLKCKALPSEASVSTDSVRQDSFRPDQRFNLTLHRVLEGESPKYSDDFLLADVKPTAERRFTEYSGDLSGRYIGAIATAAKI